MKDGRLFQLLYYLVERRSATARELAERFEVSERTIYRDVDALSAAGIPVYTQRGNGGGVRLMDQFVLDRALLSPEQQDEILFALQAILATRASEEADTLSRLSALFRRESGDWLEVDFAGWGGGEREREAFQRAREAILTRRRLDFTYYSSAGQRTRRRTEPARLVFKSGNWYLQAFCLTRQDWRVFRLGRMEELVLEEERSLPRAAPSGLEAPDAARYREVRLRLRFAPEAAYRVRDCFHPRQVEAEDGGSLLVECAFPEDGWVLGFLLSFGDRVEVLSPARWREILAREGEKISDLYEIGYTVSDLECYPDIRRAGDPPGTNKEGISMETRDFCQCCGMPLDDPKDRGTEADGSPSRDYCRYCYQGGAFTAPDAAVEDMIAFNLKFNAENGHPFGPQEQAEQMLRAWLPTLKRWASPEEKK